MVENFLLEYDKASSYALVKLIDAEHIITEGCYELLMFSQNLSGTDSHRTS